MHRQSVVMGTWPRRCFSRIAGVESRQTPLSTNTVVAERKTTLWSFEFAALAWGKGDERRDCALITETERGAVRIEKGLFVERKSTKNAVASLHDALESKILGRTLKRSC
jgi:hypothetical protein